MSKVKSGSPKQKSKASSSGATHALQTKIDELTASIQQLKEENDKLKENFQLLCKKIVDNIDISEYAFIEPDTEPDRIDIKDLLHMVQKMALMAATISSTDNIESHCEALEVRITELTNENSSFFKNKLKLQERLEFIMQERDVWKRNAETLKRMYAKLGNKIFCFECFRILTQ
jgi:chromosome segregation ATPase